MQKSNYDGIPKLPIKKKKLSKTPHKLSCYVNIHMVAKEGLPHKPMPTVLKGTRST